MNKNQNKLAVNGGSPVIKNKLPSRFLYDAKEKNIINKVIDESIKTGIPFRYAEKYEIAYEKKFISFMGNGYADAVNSGTNALFSIIGALDIPVGSEIIVPVLTDVGGVSPLLFWGLKPVIADISEQSFNVSLKEIIPKITAKTKAVIVCHIGGEPADIVPIKRYLKNRNIFLIEDCSQSHGAKIDNKKIGTFGDISFFSTMSSKLHSSGGQGALIYSNKKKYIDIVKSISDRGKIFKNNKFTGKYNHLGINSNLDELSSSIGLIQIQKLPKIIFKTNAIGEKIKKALLDNSEILSVGSQLKHSKCVYWFVRIRIDIHKIKVSKKQFCKALMAEGIPMSSEYDYNPFRHNWYNSKKVKSMLKHRKLVLDKNVKPKNYLKMLDTDFVIFIRESFSKKDVNLIIKSLLKVEEHYLKR